MGNLAQPSASVYNVCTMNASDRSLWAWDGKAVGERVKEERERQGLGIRELARRTNGRVSYSYVSHLEAGGYLRPSKNKVEAIFEALGLPTDFAAGQGEIGEDGRSLDADLEGIEVNLSAIRDLSPTEFDWLKEEIARRRAWLERSSKHTPTQGSDERGAYSNADSRPELADEIEEEAQ